MQLHLLQIMPWVYMTINKIKIYTFLLIFGFIGFVVILNPANAQLQGDTQEKFQDQEAAFVESSGFDGSVSIGSIMATIIKGFLGLLAMIFLVLILYGGYLWMTARGNEEQVKKAKDNITAATIGLAIIIAAYSITYFVFKYVGAAGGGP